MWEGREEEKERKSEKEKDGLNFRDKNSHYSSIFESINNHEISLLDKWARHLIHFDWFALLTEEKYNESTKQLLM